MTLESKASAQRPSASYQLQIIDAPSRLSPSARDKLRADFIEVSCRATGGANWQTYAPARDGWTAYYNCDGGRPEDYERISLAYSADGQLVHFCAVNRLQTEAACLVWFHIAITDPAHQALGILLSSLQALLSPDWLKSLPHPVYVMFRTPNPGVYNAVRTIYRHFVPRGLRSTGCYPQIVSGTQIATVPPGVVALARRAVQIISPECEFVSEKFVVKGYFKRFGPLYRDWDFNCHDSNVRAYFNASLDSRNQDGLLVLFGITAAVDNPSSLCAQ